MPEIVDNNIIDINLKLTKNKFKSRLKIYNEYHHTISKCMIQKKINCLISLHSFNPIFKKKKRNIDIGILSNSDRRLSNKLIKNLKSTNFIIGDNEPYEGNLIGDTMFKHGLNKNILHSLIEVRNDYLLTNSKFSKISNLLKKVITKSIKDL